MTTDQNIVVIDEEPTLRDIFAAVNHIISRLDKHDQKFEEHDQKFDRIFSKLEEHDQKFDSIFSKLEEHDQKFEMYDQKLEQISQTLCEHDKKLEQITQTLESHESKLNSFDIKFTNIENEFVKVNKKIDNLFFAQIEIKQEIIALNQRFDTFRSDIMCYIDSAYRRYTDSQEAEAMAVSRCDRLEQHLQIHDSDIHQIKNFLDLE